MLKTGLLEQSREWNIERGVGTGCNCEMFTSLISIFNGFACVWNSDSQHSSCKPINQTVWPLSFALSSKLVFL